METETRGVEVMRRLAQLAVLVPAMFVVLPAWGQTESKEDPKIRAKFLSGAYLEGKLIKVNFDKETKTCTFTLQLVDLKKTPNPEGQKRYAAVYRQYADAYRRKDNNAMKQLYDQVIAAQAAAFDVMETPYNFELKADEKLKIRLLDPPAREGADGKAKPYTPKELAAMRGPGPDANLPGYEAKLENLDVEKHVRVYIEKPKTAAKTDKKDPPPDPAEVVHPVSVIVLIRNPNEVQTGGPATGTNPFIVK